MSSFIKFKIKPKRSAYKPDAWIESNIHNPDPGPNPAYKNLPLPKKVIKHTAFTQEWAEALTPWAFYPITKYQKEDLLKALPELHRQNNYDIVPLNGGVMKQTIHKSMGGKRANGSEPYKRT